MTAPKPPMKIAIVGTGPAALLLARLLHVHNTSPSTFLSSSPSPSYTISPPRRFEITLFERSQSFPSRPQGGTLDLHAQTGLLALSDAGLLHDFEKIARKEGAALSVVDKTAQPYFELPGFLAGERPEVDRAELRGMLLASLDADGEREGEEGGDVRVKWGVEVTHVRKNEEDGLIYLDFSGGVNMETEKGYDLVVGADGAFSRVRSALSAIRPEYSGIGGYDTFIAQASAGTRALLKGGSVFAFSDGKALIAQQMGHGRVSVSAWGIRGESWAEGLRGSSSEMNRKRKGPSIEEILEEYKTWAPELTTLLQQSTGDIRQSAFYALPADFRWEHKPGITLIGDAAHLMTPFAGEGVNIALDDARRLARVLVSDGSVKEFEEEMFGRAAKAQALTRKMTQAMFFTPGAPRSTIESWVVARATYDCPESIEKVVKPFLVAGVYSFYWVFKKFI